MSNIESLLNTSKLHSIIFKTAGKIAESMEIRAYVVGGYVRDRLLNKSECIDIDIMVEGDSLPFSQRLAKELNIKDMVEFDEFKTVRLYHSEVVIEIASARKESYRDSSRKPLIDIATIEEDLLRRDFTINAIAASLSPKDFGQLFDPLGGIRDLNKGIIITPLDPDETFSDDPLRMLRAIRFAAQLKFSIAPNILESIIHIKNRLNIVSWERITEEIIKILKTDKPSIAFNKMKETSLLEYVFPELDIMSGVEKIEGKSHKDVFLHTLQVVDNAAELTQKMEIRFAALVHDIAKPPTKRFDKEKGWTFHGHEKLGGKLIKNVASRMKLSNKLRDYLILLTELHLRPIALAKENITDSAIRRLIFEAGENIDDLMILCRADITTKNKKKVSKYLSNFNRVEELMKNVKLRDELKNFQSPVTGDEIMKTFKLKPGKKVGMIKKMIEEAILDAKIENTYEDAFAYMMKNKNSFK